MENLILVGAMDGWDVPRRRLLWELGRLDYRAEALDLVFPLEEVELPKLTRAELVGAEYGLLGLPLGEQVMALYRPALRQAGILGSADLGGCRDGERVRVAGLVAVRQRPPTAKGYAFITLEDEDGLMNVVVRPDVYQSYKRPLHDEALLVVEGQVQRRGGVLNLLAKRVAELVPQVTEGPGTAL